MNMGHSGGHHLHGELHKTPPLRNGSKDVEHIVKAAIHHREPQTEHKTAIIFAKAGTVRSQVA
jgi:hypothetical protein